VFFHSLAIIGFDHNSDQVKYVKLREFVACYNSDLQFQSCVKAMGVAWHSHHFRCAVCHTNLATESAGYHEYQVLVVVVVVDVDNFLFILWSRPKIASQF